MIRTNTIRIACILSLCAFHPILNAGMLGAAARALKQSDEAFNTATKSLLITKGGSSIPSPKNIDPQPPLGISRDISHSAPTTVQLNEPALIMHWIPRRFVACAIRGLASNMSKDAAMTSCAERYKSCLEEKSIQNGLLKPSEICINYTNGESAK